MNRLTFETRIGAAGDPDSCRYALNHVLVGDGFGVACDGKILAVAPVNSKFPVEQPIAVPLSVAPTAKEHLKGHVETNGDNVLYRVVPSRNGEKRFAASSTPGRWPRADEVIPEAAQDAVVVALDVTLLSNLATAMGSDCVQLMIDPNNLGGAIPVVPTEANGSMGIIMPLYRDHKDVEKHPVKRFNAKRAEVVPKLKAMIEQYNNANFAKKAA